MRTTMRLAFGFSVTAAMFAVSGCGSDDGTAADADPKPVVANYASMVHTNYEDAVAGAKALRTAINAFVDGPSAATLEAAKKAWKDSRPAYLQSEVYRFYGGPIDDEMTGPEGLINSWPLDEAYIDYVAMLPMAGIINNPTKYPTLTKDAIAALNELEGEKNLSTGYHAIEFLLWGQDTSATGPGDRPFTDYMTGAGGTAANQARRGEYLKAIADLLVDDLESVEVAWKPGMNYAATFVADNPQTSLSKMVKGMGSLSGTELSKERMNNAYETKEQEEEHSCFSDNTHVDHVNDALGLQNVYLGKYGLTDGPGLDELVRAKNSELDGRMKADLEAVIVAINAIPEPFDQAIISDAGREKIQAAMAALTKLTATTRDVATELGLTINIE